MYNIFKRTDEEIKNLIIDEMKKKKESVSLTEISKKVKSNIRRIGRLLDDLERENVVEREIYSESAIFWKLKDYK